MELNKSEQEELIKKHYQELYRRLGFYEKKGDVIEYLSDYDISNKTKELFREIEEYLDEATPEKKPSQLLVEKYQQVLDAYVPKEKQQELLYILDKTNKFPYSVGWNRRTVRTAKHWSFQDLGLSVLFGSYYDLTFFGKNMVEYYENVEYRLALHEICNIYHSPHLFKCGELIAAELDSQKTNLAQVLEDILMSENNTNIVTQEIILGIVKSDNTHLHKILGDFMLAARLQEGVRQVICESMDEGTTEAFVSLLQVINDNDLVRFSAVKRGICVWTGICDEEHMERITNKQLNLITRALTDEAYRQELLKSNDSIELYIGLWVQGFFEVEDAIASCQKLIEEGTRNQKLVVSYYNCALQMQDFTGRIANKMIETNPEDVEFCAAFMPTYMKESGTARFNALYGKRENNYYNYTTHDRAYAYLPIPCTMYFTDEKQARNHFEILKNLKEVLPKKGQEYSPCIFPWYSVSIHQSGLADKLAMIAYMVQDNELIDTVCPMFQDMEIYDRKNNLRMLLHDPKTETQRNALILALVDKAPDTRREAYSMVSKMQLTREDYAKLRPFMKYKATDIRKNILELLEKQEDSELKETIQELLKDKKEDMRLGGLDLVVRLKKNEERKALYQECVTMVRQMEKITDKEDVIISELTGDSQADEVLNERGYGLYNPDAEFNIKESKVDAKYFSSIFTLKAAEIYGIFEKLEKLYTENQNREYKNTLGDELLLGNTYTMTTFDKELSEIERYPFAELWIGFYKEHVKDFKTLLQLVVFIDLCDRSNMMNCRQEWFEELARRLYGEEFLGGDIKQYAHRIQWKYVLINLYETYAFEAENKKFLREASMSMMAAFISLPKELSVHTTEFSETDYVRMTLASDNRWFKRFVTLAKFWDTEEEFEEMFWLCLNVNQFYGCNVMKLPFLSYIKAYTMKLITMDNLYQIIFDEVTLGSALRELYAVVEYPNPRFRLGITKFLESDGEFEKNLVMQTALELYWKLTDMILKVELKRSEVETEFSKAVSQIGKVCGVECLIDILVALGKDTLERSVYYHYYGRDTEKKVCLCHLLYVSEPLPGENGETLKRYLKGKKISDKRLVEVAMYNPKWIDCIEDYLGWPGLKSGIYYFTAHMNERFSDKTAAIIAKYTPLTTEELNEGAFDLNWFMECSSKLGEERFQVLYDSAKYISDSNKHTRARKYADAVQEKVTIEELETTISDKRNKDLLMSYALVPIQDEKALVHRYQFIQKYLKDSKQFGAQRRASEAKAASMGMQNLAINSGYTDVTRLTLNMETKLVETMQSYFDWQTAEDVLVKLAVEEGGKPVILCEKDGKALKNIPAKLKKNEVVMELKEIHSQLKEQHSRTRAMFEQFMEDGVEFTAEEMLNLQKNPIVAPMLKNLVYICGEKTGFLQGMLFSDAKGVSSELAGTDKLRVAHPFDLWKLGVWQDYQKILFERGVKQPFKQVFRELYVKTKEELDKYNSMRYAGNQIQPKKTIACLRGRRWVADYEDGLQKIYYEENIVARIYALADWFSPSDVEAPTLEWVEFSDRKTFKPIAIGDVPDRIFSEVMRDVDLAVSVAHAGGVDLETSHSTMEMRRAIVEFNLPLFGLTNVTFAGNHAVIEGKRASYTIHLGSGVIFKKGGTQIAVLPVHSQHRGKLFLPFIDEDPKTAEIMSKIVLFAEDMKIKDPYILQQIV